MNAKLVIATGILATLAGFGPGIASAQDQEGMYFSLFLGKDKLDIDQDDLNEQASLDVQSLGSNAPTGSSDLNDSDSAWGAQVGYRFNRWVAAEVGYVDLGKANYVANLTSTFTTNPDLPIGAYNYQAHSRFTTSGPTLAVVGIVPIGQRFEFYGRGGLYFADTRFRRLVDVGGIVYTAESKAGTQEFFGSAGFGWNINDSYGVRAEASYFLDVGDDDRTGEASVTILTIGIVFR